MRKDQGIIDECSLAFSLLHIFRVSVRQGSEAQRSNADRMQDPNVRLRTFDHRWPSNVPVDPTLMAEAGLHYIGIYMYILFYSR